MNDVIETLMEVRNAIQRLECITPTEHNCKQILGSIQRIDMVVEYLKHVHIVEKEDNDGKQEN